MTSNFANQQSLVTALQRFEGTGRLRCEHGNTWNCVFSITRLLNGRLQVSVVPDVEYSSSKAWNNWLSRCEPFAVEGTDEHGFHISASNIHFTRTKYSFHDFRKTLIGYAQSAARRPNRESYSSPVTIKCELANLRFTSLISPLALQIEDFAVEIGHLGWQSQGEIEEHSNAYQHATISAYLRIQEVPEEEQDRAIECLQGITELLSVARRGHVFLVARHRYEMEGQWLDSQFAEPYFTVRGWPRALIPDDDLGDFLTTAYPRLATEYQNLELGNVIDHYLQALTLRSVWPLSLGIFTAMETLKAAFFRQTENAAVKFWVVPPGSFESKREMFNELIDVLCNHFPRFCGLRRGERDSLKAQLKGLNRRSYKTQLQMMLDQLGVSYDKNELQAFINIRNLIIHEGTPVESDIPIADYWDRTSRAWKQIESAASLFERALLAVLGYMGPSEYFDASEEAQNERY
jgi:hypothetical protein